MIYIVITVFNRWHHTKSCIDSLIKQTYKDFKIVIVDDGSTDGTYENIFNMYPDVDVVKGDGNLWWTGGMNKGIEYAFSKKNVEYILSLNNDTITYPHYLQALVDASEKHPNSLIGSLAINHKTKKRVYAAGFIKWYKDKYIGLLDTLEEYEKKGTHEVDYFPGRGVLIPKKVFDNIGLFDQETFPQYIADYDFTLRAREAGFKIYCSFEAELGIYPEESGANITYNKKTFKNFKEHLFSSKKAGSLPLFYKYVFRHSPTLQIIPCVIMGTLKRTIGFWFKTA